MSSTEKFTVYKCLMGCTNKTVTVSNLSLCNAWRHVELGFALKYMLINNDKLCKNLWVPHWIMQFIAVLLLERFKRKYNSKNLKRLIWLISIIDQSFHFWSIEKDRTIKNSNDRDRDHRQLWSYAWYISTHIAVTSLTTLWDS
jgi:hypothetical protein